MLFKKGYGEFAFQVMVAIILFMFYSYSQDLLFYNEKNVEFTAIPYKAVFFFNYALAAMVINYILLPKFYATKKFVLFGISVTVLVFLVILVDEFVLEQIYFPETRGAYFPGVLFSLMETLPLIFVFVGFKLAWDYNRKQSEIESLRSLVQESELQFLKSQINPHFLFNNLNNLYVHAIDNSPETPNIIIELSSVLRYMLYDCKAQYTPLEKEIANLKHYTALNKLQIGHRGTIVFKVDELPDDYVIAPLILIVFVENAFKHSTASQSEDIVIHIAVKVNSAGFLDFYCGNSYLSKANIDKLDKGIGLSNVKKRLALLYDNAHDLKISQMDNQYEVRLLLQLKKKE